MIAYPAMLDVSRDLIRFVAHLLRMEREARGTRKGTRALTCWVQAVFAIAWFRDRPNLARHGRAFGISQATAYRYLHEVIDVLTDRAPDLHQALRRAAEEGVPHLIMDGKVFDTGRCRIKTTSVKGEPIDAWFSGKTSDFGGNVQALFEPDGFPIWTSDAAPGGTVDIEAARKHVLPAVYPVAKTLPILASATAPTTPCSARSAASANAASPCSPSAGPPSSTPHSAPAESATSSAPRSFSSISNTARSRESQ